MPEILKRLLRSPQGAAGVLILLLALLMVAGGAHVAPFDPEAISILTRYRPPGAEHWFGTDQTGRDAFTRVVYGASQSLLAALVAVGVGLIVGTAIGLAMAGFRPVIEIQFDGFVFPAFDQITSQLAKLTNRHEGALSMPVVIRIPYGGHIGAVEHHQESPEAYFAHTPGLRVVAPSTSNDAYWMIQEAIRSNDPVIFLEPKSRYWQKGEVELEQSALPLHASRVVRTGTDITLAGHGAMVTTLLQAAAIAEGEGTSCEVVDVRSLSPVDYGPILDSVRKTGRMVYAQEASGFSSVSGGKVVSSCARSGSTSAGVPWGASSTAAGSSGKTGRTASSPPARSSLIAAAPNSSPA